MGCPQAPGKEDIWSKDELPQRGNQSLQEKWKVCDVPQGPQGLSRTLACRIAIDKARQSSEAHQMSDKTQRKCDDHMK
ncbi:hypothetical protein STEG23_016640 [Scotinomys teguina]